MDAQDHVFIVNRGNLSAKEKINAIKPPPVIEFDQNGRMVNAWGDWDKFPGRPHGCFVDYQGNIWVAGNEDGIVQKYSHDGSKLMLQIGTKGEFDSSDSTINGAPMNSSHTSFCQILPSIQRMATCTSATAMATGASRSLIATGAFFASGASKEPLPRMRPG